MLALNGQPEVSASADYITNQPRSGGKLAIDSVQLSLLHIMRLIPSNPKPLRIRMLEASTSKAQLQVIQGTFRDYTSKNSQIHPHPQASLVMVSGSNLQRLEA